MLVNFSQAIFSFANHLRHSTHRAESTPGSRLEQRHYHQAKQHRGKHYAVKAKGILHNPRRRAAGSVGPRPRKLKRPEQRHNLTQRLRLRCYKISLPQHVAKHSHKEAQKAEAEPFGDQKLRRSAVTRPLPLAAQLCQKQTASAVTVAEQLVTAKQCQQNRHHKINHSQPGKKDIEKAQDKINYRP